MTQFFLVIDRFNTVRRELKRREKQRTKEAHKANKAAAAPQNDVKEKVEAKPSEDDLSPNVCALNDVTRSLLTQYFFVAAIL